MKKQSPQQTEEKRRAMNAHNKKKVHWFYWSLVALWMLFIFYLSHQPASASKALSGGVLSWLISFLPVDLSHSSLMHFLLRKAAHLSAYFILGALVIQALSETQKWSQNAGLYALLICIFYALTDEMHQLFIPGRSGEMRDVLIDAAGAATGIGCWLLWKHWRKK